MVKYINQLPPAFSDTYVKATTFVQAGYEAHQATDPSNSLLAGSEGSWQSGMGRATNQRFHIDLGSAKTIKRIYYSGWHINGSYTGRGVKNIIIQGSNNATAFSTLTYATDTNWTAITAYSDAGLTTVKSTFDQHSAVNEIDIKYLYIDNSTPYRYYAIKCVDDWGDTSYMGILRIILQTKKSRGRSSPLMYY